jgi:hypothetical protein
VIARDLGCGGRLFVKEWRLSAVMDFVGGFADVGNVSLRVDCIVNILVIGILDVVID